MTEQVTSPIIIHFSNVYSFKDLETLQEDMNEGGVYIWGLVFQKENEKPTGQPKDNTEPFDKANHFFIPYYVGQSSKNLWKCFKERHNNPNRNTLYILLDYEYIKEFYKDDKLPEMLGTGSNSKKDWFEQNKYYFSGKIIYYNNYHILKYLYQFSDEQLYINNNYSYSANIVKEALRKANKPIEEKTLENYISTFYKKIYFCYAKGFATKTFGYKNFESYIFYRLKGKTLSKHDNFKTVKQKFESISICLNLDLELFKPNISQNFFGY